MTVQKLIDELQKVENKDLSVYIYYDSMLPAIGKIDGKYEIGTIVIFSENDTPFAEMTL